MIIWHISDELNIHSFGRKTL